MTPAAIDIVTQAETMLRKLPQIDIPTEHKFHAGIYARTVFLPAGTVITGALIKIATMLIVCGNAIVYVGNHSTQLLGHNILTAAAGRKQCFVAVEDTWLTMMFATEAKTVAEAEAQFTDESDMLLSNLGKGEPCQE